MGYLRKAFEAFDEAVFKSRCMYSHMAEIYRNNGVSPPDPMLRDIAAHVFPSIFGYKYEPEKWAKDIAEKQAARDKILAK